MDLSVIGKIIHPHQAPIKSLKFLNSNANEKYVYLIAGSYDQVISISKLNCEEKENNEILTNKIFINLAELNGIDGYCIYEDKKVIIYAVGQGMEYYEYFLD